MRRARSIIVERRFLTWTKALIDEMGGRCGRCGVSVDDGAELEFDHFPLPRTWNPASMNRWRRLASYRLGWRAVLLRLLGCNASTGGVMGNRRRWSTTPTR